MLRLLKYGVISALAAVVCAVLSACTAGEPLRLTELATARPDEHREELAELLLPDIESGFMGKCVAAQQNSFTLQLEDGSIKQFATAGDTLYFSGRLAGDFTVLRRIGAEALQSKVHLAVWTRQDGRTADIVCIARE